MSLKCVVVDYGSGNVFSVMHALNSLDVEASLSSDPKHILAADRVVLPGVGAFGRATDQLRRLGLDETIRDFIATERPFLGICVGMQLLMEQGKEFGTHRGLGVFSGTVDKIDLPEEDGGQLRVPLIGWYPVVSRPGQKSGLFNSVEGAGVNISDTYYFVHSFAVRPSNSSVVLATVSYAGQPVPAAIGENNVMGVQFHPERSGAAGLSLIDRFLKL